MFWRNQTHSFQRIMLTMGPDLAIDWASFINKTTKCRNFNKASLVIESYMLIIAPYKARGFDTYTGSNRQCVAKVVEHRSQKR